MDSEQTRPMTENTVFLLASMTKPLTVAGLLKLCKTGALGLEDEVGKYLPQFAGRQVISGIGFEKMPVGGVAFIVGGSKCSLENQNLLP